MMKKITYIINNVDSWSTKIVQSNDNVYDLLLLKTHSGIFLRYKFLKLKQFCFNENIKDYVFSYQSSTEFVEFKTMLNRYAKSKKYAGDLEYAS
jgi:hypothetical protein